MKATAESIHFPLHVRDSMGHFLSYIFGQRVAGNFFHTCRDISWFNVVERISFVEPYLNAALGCKHVNHTLVNS